jgi:hypothetical protein
MRGKRPTPPPQAPPQRPTERAIALLFADGAAAQAKFGSPVDVKADAQGNLYVADRNNGVVRKISASGTVSTVAGTPGKYGFMPDALPGAIPPPEGLAVAGDVLYISTLNGIVKVNL